MKRVFFLDIISSLFIILFLSTGVYKLLYQEPFLAALDKQPVLRNYAGFLGILIPLLEVAVAFCLLISILNDNNLLRKWGFIGSLGLMTIFTVYVGYMLIAHATHLPCTCGGIVQQLNWHQHFYFNSAFTLLALIGLRMNAKIGGSSKMSFAA